jgi:hypothetical protein
VKKSDRGRFHPRFHYRKRGFSGTRIDFFTHSVAPPTLKLPASPRLRRTSRRAGPTYPSRRHGGLQVSRNLKFEISDLPAGRQV